MASGSCRFCSLARKSERGYISIFHCCLCDQYFIKAKSYNTHNTQVHKNKGPSLPTAPFACVDCEEDFYDEGRFEAHLAAHTDYRRQVENAKSSTGSSTKYSTRSSTKSSTNASTKAKSTGPLPQNIPLYLCETCGRDFIGKKALKKHHKACTGNRHTCISDKCIKTFKSLHAMVSHLESGACKGGYNYKKINKLLCERDKMGLITVPGASKMLHQHENMENTRIREYEQEQKLAHNVNSKVDTEQVSDQSLNSGTMTPSSTGSDEFYEVISGRMEDFDIISLDSSEFSEETPSMASSIIISEPNNPNQCCICEKVFGKKRDLAQHMASPTHSPKIYHCGLSFLGLQTEGPIRQFKTLSGLVSHIERGACRGGNETFEVAVQALGHLADALGFSGMGGSGGFAKYLSSSVAHSK